jgi:glucose/mannose-6-phosphate isomerase
MSATVDSTNQLAEIRDLPVHLEDALWRVESAAIAPSDSAGLAICGMGGSGVGALLAIGALGPRATRPVIAVRDYALPSWVGEDWTVLVSSYSGNTEETLACWEASAHARRIVVSTGGALVERAREARVPVIPVPGGFQPRAAVGYATVVALEVAALCGAAPSMRTEVEAAARLLSAEQDSIEVQARSLATELGAGVPVVVGSGITAPVAYRWKCQVNENANRAAFWSELPEANHNEIEGWRDRSSLAPIFLEDSQAPEGIRRRFELTAEIIGGAHHVSTRGETPTERLMSLVHLGDLFSYHLAINDGTDPVSIPALERLKAGL